MARRPPPGPPADESDPDDEGADDLPRPRGKVDPRVKFPFGSSGSRDPDRSDAEDDARPAPRPKLPNVPPGSRPEDEASDDDLLAPRAPRRRPAGKRDLFDVSDAERPGADLASGSDDDVLDSDDERPGLDSDSDADIEDALRAIDTGSDASGLDLGSDDERIGVELSDDDRAGVDPGDDARRPARPRPRGLPNVPPDSSAEDERSVPAGAGGRGRRPPPRGRAPAGGDDDAGDDGAGKRPPRRPPPRGRAPAGSDDDDEVSAESGDLPVADLDQVDASDLGSVSARVSDLGPIGASGPLVIIDDEEPDASSRYQASIVDDSARLAGARGSGERRGPRARGDASAADIDPDDLDGDVPVPERSARATRQSARAAPPPRSGKRAVVVALVVVALVALLVGLAIGLGVGEWRRRRDLGATIANLGREREAAVAEAERIGADALGKAAEATRQADEARVALEAQRQAEREAARREADAARAAGEAAGRRAGEEAGRAQGREEAQEGARAELEAAREAAATEARAEADAERERALADARVAADAALAAQAGTAEERRRDDLADLERRLRADLDAAATREEEEAMARMLEAERAAAAGGAGGGAPGGGAAPSGGDDWDAFFAGGGGAGTSAAAPSGDDGLEGEGVLHPVDRVWAWVRESIHGKLGYRNLSHFSRTNAAGEEVRKTRHELRLNLEYRDWLWRSEDQSAGLRLATKLDVRVDDDRYAVAMPHGIDDEERRRPIVWAEELHLDLTVDAFTVKAGWQVFAWGTGDLFNPTDILNPIDFSDLFDTRRISVPAVAAEVSLEHVSLEAVVIPSFTRSRLPLRGKRFDLIGTSPVPVLRPDDPPQTVTNTQGGARATVHAGGWDVSVCGFSGWDDLPSGRLAAISLNPLVIAVDPVFDRIHMLGADFATTLGFLGVQGKLGDVLGGIQLHGEAAHIWADGERQDDILQGVIGLNYTWIDLIAEHDLTLVIEYAGDHATDDGDAQIPGVRLNRVLRGAVLARLVYAFDDDLSFEVNAAVITHGDENALIHPALTWNPTDNLRLALGGDIFLGDEETFFGQFKRDGRVILDVAWEW